MSDAQNEASSAEPLKKMEVDLGTENLIAAYESVAEWIRFADAKAAAVLTVTGALSSVLIPTMDEYLDTHPDGMFKTITVVLFVCWLGAGLLSSYYAFRCILPFRQKGQHPALERCSHFHPAAISSRYRMDQHDEFVAGYQAAGVQDFQKEVLAGLLIDSHISAAKYTHVTLSIRLLGASALMGMLYLLMIQF